MSLVEPAQPVPDRRTGLGRAEPRWKRVTGTEKADLAVDEEQDLATLVIRAQNLGGIAEPDQLQVCEQGVDRRGPVARLATDCVANPHDDIGVAAVKDLLPLRIFHESGDERVDEGLSPNGAWSSGARPDQTHLIGDAECL